jgi:hypothetical protein
MSTVVGAVTVASAVFGMMLGQISIGTELLGVLIAAGVVMSLRV